MISLPGSRGRDGDGRANDIRGETGRVRRRGTAATRRNRVGRGFGISSLRVSQKAGEADDYLAHGQLRRADRSAEPVRLRELLAQMIVNCGRGIGRSHC
nr:hypothetical protein [Nitrosospira sp. Nsp2]